MIDANKWHDFGSGERACAVRWEGSYVHWFKGTAEDAEECDGDPPKHLHECYYEPAFLGQEFGRAALAMCDLVGATETYRAGVLAVVEEREAYDAKVAPREFTADEAAAVGRIVPVLAALADVDTTVVRVSVTVDRNHAPPIETWRAETFRGGEWWPLVTARSYTRLSEYTLLRLAMRVTEEAQHAVRFITREATCARERADVLERQAAVILNAVATSEAP